jgi:hypothetical protein
LPAHKAWQSAPLNSPTTYPYTTAFQQKSLVSHEPSGL